MHELLQTFSHLPQPIQLRGSILILKKENSAAIARTAPTGQMVLQYNLPHEELKKKIIRPGIRAAAAANKPAVLKFMTGME